MAQVEDTAREAEERPARRGVVAFVAAVGLAHVYVNTVGLFSENLVSAFHFACFALLSLLAGRRGGPWWAVAWWWTVPVAAAASGFYLIFFEDAFYEHGQEFGAADWVFAAAGVAGAVELVRRTSGWVIPALVAVAVTYVGWWGRFVPGVFSFPGLSAESLLYRLYFSPEGMFGLIARISWSYVFTFVLLGAFLLRSGGGDFILELARAAAGRVRGGPGYVAVLASGLMGSISGSAIANTAATGTITIPLMKRTGFSPRFAAAVEAAASTGGQLMPPVMGAGAFVMASYTQVPYLQIIAVAVLPALLYFLTVALFVRLEAAREETVLAEPPPGRKAAAVVKEGWRHGVPLVVLIAMLVRGHSPTWAAAAAMASIVAASWIGRRGMTPADVVAALDRGVRAMIPTALLLVAIGLVVNVITTTGLGNTFSLMVVDWSHGSVALMLLLLALVSLVLGMGLPVTASYIVLAAVAASGLQSLLLEGWLVEAIQRGEVGEAVRQVLALQGVADPTLLGRGEIRELLAALPVEMKSLLIEQAVPASMATAALLTAHLILFWLSQDSNVTPPVCLAAYTAATLAGSRPMATGLLAWKVAKGLYVVPLLMAYQPFVGAGWAEASKVFVIGLAATVAVAGALEGFGGGVAGWTLRLGGLGAAWFFLAPGPSQQLRLWGAVALGIVVAGRICWRGAGWRG